MSCSLPTHLQLQRRSSAVQVFGARVLANTVSSKGLSAEPLVVGLTGRTKPRSLEDFLNEFVADVRAALKNGVVVNGCNHSRHTLFCLRCAGACICQI